MSRLKSSKKLEKCLTQVKINKMSRQMYLSDTGSGRHRSVRKKDTKKDIIPVLSVILHVNSYKKGDRLSLVYWYNLTNKLPFTAIDQHFVQR